MARVNYSLSVFFPCYNESGNITTLTENAVHTLSRLVDDYEIVLVNDASTDNTGAIADELAKRFSRVRVVHHPANKGYGGAVWTGLKQATKDAVFFSDGDGQFDLSELDKFLPELTDPSVAVVGYRIKRADPFHRKVFAFMWGRVLLRALLGIKLRDLDCAFKLFHTRHFETMQPECGGAMVTAEIIYKLRQRGVQFKQIGVNHYPRKHGTQTGGSLKVIVRAFRELSRTYWSLKLKPLFSNRTQSSVNCQVRPAAQAVSTIPKSDSYATP
jgi:glycosyltransferase involved in cell wall biosynthesis